MRISYSRPCTLLVALFSCVLHARADAQIVIDLSHVTVDAPARARFLAWVDQAVAGSPGYNFSATDAAFAYRLTPTPAYCQLAVARVEAQVAAAEALIANAQRPAVSANQYLYSGEMIRDLALAYDWCPTYSSVAQRARWAAYADQTVWNIWNHALASWGGHAHPWPGWSVTDPGNNYYYSFLEATILWSLANPAATCNASHSQTCRSFLELVKLPPLDLYFSALPGGGSSEGTAYGLSHARLFELYRIWRDSTGINLAALNPHLDESIDWWIHATVPGLDAVAPIGDQARVSYPEIYDYHRNLLLQARAMSTSEPARARASWWLNSISIWRMTSGFNFRHDLLPAGNPGTAPAATWYHATGTGRLFARSGWNADAFWLAFAAGPYNQSHAHQDQGSFTLYGQRGFLAVTENIWSHSGIQQGTEVHNVVRFVHNGETLRQRLNTVSSMSVTTLADGTLRADANLTPAYGSGSPVQGWTRRLDYRDREVEIVDLFQVATGVEAIFQINLPVVPQINGRLARAGALSIDVVEPLDAVLTAVDWTTVGDPDFLRGWKLEVRGSGNGFRVRLGNSDMIFSNGFE